MKNILILLFFSLISSSVMASEWMYVFSSDTEKYYADLESFEKVNNYNDELIKGWFKLEIFNDIEKDGQGVGDKTLVMYNLDCKFKKIGIAQGTRYKNNKPFGTSLSDPDPNMKYVIPDSIGAEILSRACSIYRIQNGTASYMEAVEK